MSEIETGSVATLIACEIDTHFAIFSRGTTAEGKNIIKAGNAAVKRPAKHSTYTTEPNYKPFYHAKLVVNEVYDHIEKRIIPKVITEYVCMYK